MLVVAQAVRPASGKCRKRACQISCGRRAVVGNFQQSNTAHIKHVPYINVLQQQSLPQYGLQLGGICRITACHLADTSVLAIYHYYIEAAG